MSFEDRFKSTIDQAAAPLVKQLVDAAAAERDEAIRAAKVEIFQEAEQATQGRIADAEARVRAMMEEQYVQVRADDRAAVERDTRKQCDIEHGEKIREALEAAQNRMRIALADGEAKAAADLKAAVAGARVNEREIEMAGVSRLLESVRGLDGATALSEVLDALALAAAREAARAAVVVLRNDRIQGWRLSGFGPRDMQPKSIDLPLSESGVIGHAIGAARAVTTRDSESAGIGPGFETLPADRMGLAVPVIVGGRVVAVVYADAVTLDGHERHVPSSWPELIEVLARHAGRCLEALTTRKTMPKIPPPVSTGASAAAHPASSTATPPDASNLV
jgi:GAF domain